MRILRTTVLATLGMLGTASSAAAAPVTFQVTGTIDSFIRGGVVEQLALGSPFQMTMTWDTETPVSSSTATTAAYDNAIVEFYAVAGGITFLMSPESDGGSSLTITNDEPNDRLLGSVIDSTPSSTDDSLLVWFTRWDLLFPSTTLSSTALPTSGPFTVESGLAKLTLYSTHTGTDVLVQATITSAQSVPEPSTLALFGFGALGLARWGRRNLTSRTPDTQ